jgi:hypothetical protein
VGKTMKAVPAREFTNIKMIQGNEKEYSIIVDAGVVKQWVGIGWIELRKATTEDKEKYPNVLRGYFNPNGLYEK